MVKTTTYFCSIKCSYLYYLSLVVANNSKIMAFHVRTARIQAALCSALWKRAWELYFHLVRAMLNNVPAVTRVDRWKHSLYIVHNDLGVRAPYPYVEKQDDEDTLYEQIRHNEGESHCQGQSVNRRADNLLDVAEMVRTNHLVPI